MLGTAAKPDERESTDDGRVFLKPLSVLLRCKTGRVSNDAFDELVLLRECWLLAFLDASLSRSEPMYCVSYGCLVSNCSLGSGIDVSKDEARPGFEKLKSMLGSTPPEVDMNELGRELYSSPALLVAKDVPAPGEGKPWRF